MADRDRHARAHRPDAVIAHTLLDEMDLILADLAVLAVDFRAIPRRCGPTVGGQR